MYERHKKRTQLILKCTFIPYVINFRERSMFKIDPNKKKTSHLQAQWTPGHPCRCHP